MLGLALGAGDAGWSDAWAALLDRAETFDQIVVREKRMPRTGLGIIGGAALGAAGVVAQAVVGNRLADPGLLGVSAGSSLAVVLAITILGVSTIGGYVWFALIGAGAVSLLVFLAGSGRRSMDPVRLILAGVAISAAAGAISSMVLLADATTLARYRLWWVGSLAGRSGSLVLAAAPVMATGLVMSMAVAGRLDGLVLGDDLAEALGVRVRRTKLLAGLAVTLCAGGATAAMGPVSFIGLVAATIARRAMGSDHRWSIPAGMLAGAIVLTGSDIIGRLVLRPAEVEVGVIAAIIGDRGLRTGGLRGVGVAPHRTASRPRTIGEPDAGGPGGSRTGTPRRSDRPANDLPRNPRRGRNRSHRGTGAPVARHPRRKPMTAPDVSGTVGAAARLLVDDLVVGYDRPIVHGLDLEVLDGAFTAIVGPNACGKSTLLRAMARLLVPTQGAVLLDGRSVAEMPTRTVAKEIGLLPQSATAPDGLLVADLVARARFPHRSWYDRWSMADERAVQEAMAEAGVDSLADRPVDELSGGQRQRVWLALCLAQETPILLLDEPTTYLDLAHQIDVLELIRRLQHDHGRTVVAVLHDLQHASRYADRIVAMGGGRLVAVGTPAEVLVPEVIEDVYGIGCVVIEDPVTGGPLAVPTVSR